MRGSGILEQTVEIDKVSKRQATHFALYNGANIRYLIAIKGGKNRLKNNIAAYSKKLLLLMKVLDYLPFSVLRMLRFGHFVEAKIHPTIEEQLKKTKAITWNMIIGTYDEKQKVVLQCFNPNQKLATFIKVGNKGSETEMLTEIKFLKTNNNFRRFDLPLFLGAKIRKKEDGFNIQVTKEFIGDKVDPILTKDIYLIYKEIAGKVIILNGIEYEFSHGDFAPWNLRVKNGRYTIFDWEHCGIRVKGFDIVHYATAIELVVDKKCLNDAVETGIKKIKQIEPSFSIDKEKFLYEFKSLRLWLG